MPEEGENMLVLALVREGRLGWRLTAADGSVRYFATPLEAVLALGHEADFLACEMGGWGIEAAHA